jgi:hypothetical protein
VGGFDINPILNGSMKSLSRAPPMSPCRGSREPKTFGHRCLALAHYDSPVVIGQTRISISSATLRQHAAVVEV